jgi:hypothetical protein
LARPIVLIPHLFRFADAINFRKDYSPPSPLVRHLDPSPLHPDLHCGERRRVFAFWFIRYAKWVPYMRLPLEHVSSLWRTHFGFVLPFANSVGDSLMMY